MARSWFTIKALTADHAEISIFDEIGFWGVNAKEFIAQFKAIQAPNVTLFINSPGGSVFDALAIFNTIQASGKNVTVKVLGIAASAASYIAMSGTRIEMPENTFLFVHNPINAVYGNADEMREMADVLDKIGASLLATYVRRSGKPEEEVKALLDAESYLTAQECLDLGLCDEVTPAITATAKFDTDRADVPANVMAIFAKAAKPAPAGVPLAEQIATMAAAAGLADHAAVFALDPAVTSVEAAQQVIASAREITALCAVAKHADLAAALIKGRKTVAEASAELVATLAAEDEAAHVDTSQRSENKPKPVAQAGGPVAYWSARKPA